MRSKVQFHNIDTSDPRFGLHGGGAWDLQASLINIAKTEFMLNSYLKATQESMHFMVVDTFDTLNAVDSSKSSGYGLSDGTIRHYLFYDDFSSQIIDTSKWQAISGTWAVENGELSGTAGTTQDYILSMVGWADYILTCDVWIKSSPWDAGLAFRTSDVNNHYLLAIRSNSSSGSHIDLYKRVSGSYTLLASANPNPNIPDDTKTTISIQAIGTNITAYVNGTQVLTCSDSTYSLGKIGCRVHNGTHTHFDNLVVTPPNVSPESPTVIVSIPETFPIIPAKIFFTADDFPGSGTISYYASRDGGTTWTPVQKDSITDLSSQPLGQSLVVKAELTGDAYISAWAYGVA